MTIAMEIHDSYLQEMHIGPNGMGHALFHAYIYRSEGQVFESAYESGWHNLRFDFEGLRIEGAIPDFKEKPYASDGELWINGFNEKGMIYLPAKHNGDICLEVRLSPSFETFKIHATAMTSSLQGEFKLETHWDANGKIIQK